MFLWDSEKKQTVLDMAITGKFSVYDMEKQVGISRYHVGNLLKSESQFILQEQARQPISTATENTITDFHEAGQESETIAEKLGLTAGEVRRVVLVWEKALSDLEEEDAAIDSVGAGIAHLALLKSEHPTRLYEDDAAAAIGGQGANGYLPMRARQIEAYLP